MPRFFVDPDAIQGDTITVTGDDARHIARSLRMAVGDEVTLSDGLGVEYSCRLTKIRDEECIAEVLSSEKSKREPTHPVTLYMAYPKGDKLETVVQKSVELGASHIVPFESERCIKRPAPEKAEKQTARLQRIADEAAKQCGRGILPTVHTPVSFGAMLDMMAKHSLVLFCYEKEDTTTIRAALENATGLSDLAVIVGAEGGFSEKEAAAIVDKGAKCVSLGPRILRCETAPDYALAVISCFLEL